MTDQSAEKPVPERFAGAVMPGGRGMEQHGVPFSGAPDLVDETEMGDPLDVPEPKPEPDPIPVRIVSEAGRERRMFRILRHVATRTDATQVVGQNENRTKLKVRNIGPEAAWVAAEQHMANSVFGFPLAVGAEFETTGEGALWARTDPSAATDVAQLAVFHEYAVGV